MKTCFFINIYYLCHVKLILACDIFKSLTKHFLLDYLPTVARCLIIHLKLLRIFIGFCTVCFLLKNIVSILKAILIKVTPALCGTSQRGLNIYLILISGQRNRAHTFNELCGSLVYNSDCKLNFILLN